MIKVTEDTIEEIVLILAGEFDPVKVILFGSRARGGAPPESDIDILVVEDVPFSKNHTRWNEIVRIRKALRSIKHPKDILVFTQDEFEKWRHSPNHVISVSLNEGKVIYERP